MIYKINKINSYGKIKYDVSEVSDISNFSGKISEDLINIGYYYIGEGTDVNRKNQYLVYVNDAFTRSEFQHIIDQHRREMKLNELLKNRNE